MNKFAIAAVAAGFAVLSSARTLVWNGGSSGDLSSASWSAGGAGLVAPEAGDDLEVGTAGSFSCDVADLSVGSFSVTAAGVSISGSHGIAIASGSSLSVSGAGAVSFDLPLVLGSDPSGEVRVDVMQGAEATFLGAISGSSKIVFGHKGVVHFKGSNTFTGRLDVTNGTFHVWSDGAFGTTDGATYFNGPARLDSGKAQVRFHGVTTAEPLHFRSKGNQDEVYVESGTTNVFRGFVDDSYYMYWQLMEDSCTVFSNGFKTATFGPRFYGRSELVFAGDAASRFYENYTASSATASSRATMRVAAPLRAGYAVRGCFMQNGMRMTFDVDDAMYFPNPTSDEWPAQPVAPQIRFEGSGVFDLNGYDQHCLHFYTSNQSSSIVTNSAVARATLHLMQSYETGTATSYSGKFGGALTLSLEGPKPLTLSGPSTPDVRVALSGGASLTIASAAWEGTNFVVSGGSTLAVSSSDALSSNAVVRVEDDGDAISHFALSGVQQMAGVFVNGVELAAGEWGAVGSGAANEDEHFTGSGTVLISVGESESTGVWTGGGADALSTTPANWEGGAPVSGTIALTFAQGGTEARLARDLTGTGVTFDTPPSIPSFTVAAAQDAPTARLGVGSDGVTMVDRNDGTPRTYAVSAGMKLEASPQRWNLAGRANKLLLEGPVSATVGSVSITRNGAGSLYMTGTNTFAGSMTFNGGTNVFYGGALGAAGNSITLQGDASMSATYMFMGGVHDQNITATRYNSSGRSLHFAPNATNFFTRLFTIGNTADFFAEFGAGSRTVFSGGISEKGLYDIQLYVRMRAGACMEVRDCPIEVSTSRAAQFYNLDSGAAQIVLDAEDCRSKTGFAFADAVNVRFDRDWVFKTNTIASPLFLQSVNARHPSLDLNGHDQGVGDARDANFTATWCYTHSRNSRIKSATPATLHVFQNTKDAPEWHPIFEGAASLEKSGTNVLRLAGISTTTGTLAVANGTLGFAGSGSWARASALSVSGGVLDVDAAGRLGDLAEVRLSGGKLRIASGVTLKTQVLYLPDGAGGFAKAAGGLYSAERLPAYVEGGGFLKVRSRGVVVIFQ